MQTHTVPVGSRPAERVARARQARREPRRAPDGRGRKRGKRRALAEPRREAGEGLREPAGGGDRLAVAGEHEPESDWFTVGESRTDSGETGMFETESAVVVVRSDG